MDKKTRFAIIREAKKERDKHTPYIWGGVLGQDPGTDCSGLVVGIWARCGVTPQGYDASAAYLYAALPRIKEPAGGDLCFYGKHGRVTHVTIFVGRSQQTGQPQCIGANGGNRLSKNILIAKIMRAFVRQVPVFYRKDFVGYGSVKNL